MSRVPNDLDLGRLTKPVSALALVPKTAQITRVGRQAYNSMLFLAQKQGDTSDPFFQAPLSQILTGFAAAKDAAKEVRRHLLTMLSTTVEWQSPSPAETNWGACNLLAEAQLEKIKGETWVRWAYPPTIRAELLNPQRFAQINMTTIAQLRTHAAVALYEICARYRDNPSGVTSRQHWTWWLPVLTGSPKETRKTEYRFFKRDYINPAIDNINEISELLVEIVEHKRGRSIEEIQFTVARKQQPASMDDRASPTPIDMSQIVRGRGLGLPTAVAEELHYRFGIDALRIALDALERRNAVKGQEPIADPIAYVRAVLKNGAHKPAPPSVPAPAEVLPAPPSPQEAPAPVDARESREKQRLAQLRQEVEALHPQELETYLRGLRQALVERGGMHSLIRRIDAGNWKSPLVLHELISFYAKANYGHAWKGPAQGDLKLI